MSQNRRAYFRIGYPADTRPRIVFGASISEVLECSEGGIRFRTTVERPAPGTPLSGRIIMCHGGEFRFAGTVVWCDAESTALKLDRIPLPFLAILREQLFLRNG